MNLSLLHPTNLLSEKQKFLSDQRYNPQFTYSTPVDELLLTKHGIPKDDYIALAKEILNIAYHNRSEEDLFALEGKRLTQNDVHIRVKNYLDAYDLNEKYSISWSEDYISRATLHSDSIAIRLPVDYYDEGLQGMLYHEIGTHALRRLNYEQQPWYKQKNKFGFGDYLKTEEGLASLHALMAHSFKNAYISAIRYLAVHYASEGSFSDVWSKLTPYVDNLERRWSIVMRAKRGTTDTSTSGFFSKDQVYFEGLLNVWHWLESNNYNLRSLYFGKISYLDAKKAVELNPEFQPILPDFYISNPEEYVRQVREIGRTNLFNQITPSL